MEQKYIKASELARVFGVNRQTIQNWINKGLLTMLKLDGCHYVTMESVRAIEDEVAGIVASEEAVEAYKKENRQVMEEYEESVRNHRKWMSANNGIKLSMPRITELLRIMFNVIRVGDFGVRRGQKIMELMIYGYDANCISERYHTSTERIRQIVEKEMRMLNLEVSQYEKIKEENKRLRMEVDYLKNNVGSLKKVVETTCQEIGYKATDIPHDLLTTPLREFNLSARTINCLMAYVKEVDDKWEYEPIQTVGELVRHNKTDILRIRNFGKKSLNELDDLMEKLGLEWGTNYVVDGDGKVMKAS